VDDGIAERLSNEELAHFNHTVSSLTGDLTQLPDTSISPETVISHLVECHPQHAKAINSSSSLLARLLRAHAAFPFPANSSESLTQPALLRAVVLLTANGEKLFKAAAWIGGEITIRGRTPEQRLDFIFAALASSPAIPSVNDLLDVLCRVPYPRTRDRKTGDLSRELLVDLIPLAERLHGTEKNHQGPVETGHVSATDYDQLAHLVASLHSASVVEGLAQADIDIDAFKKWAVKVGFHCPLILYVGNRSADGQSRLT